jgi:hypothetical protein
MYNRISIIIFLSLLINTLRAQDLDQLLTQTTGNETEYTTATFKSTHIVNGHSIEQMKAGELDIRFSHRFGTFNEGPYTLWGLDQAHVHFGGDYGITNWLMVGLGRGTYEKTYDGLLKFSILRQSHGAKNMPISLSFLTTAAVNTLKTSDMGLPGNAAKVYFWDRVSFVNQLLIARKFNERFSLEINPTLVHRNMTLTEMDPNDLLSVGIGARFKLTKRISFNAEYYYLVPPLRDYRSQPTYGPLAVGFDIETGGHVFQIILTNSLSMIEKGFIGETTGQWGKNDIHLGFNISRVFTLKKYNH